MPYTMDNMPDAIKGLPPHAQEMWIAAYNAAHERYEGDEAKANATAWAAVEEKYKKDESGQWQMMQAATGEFPDGCVKITTPSRLTAAADSPETPDADKGYKWHVQLAVAGVDTPGRLEYPLAVLHAAVPLYGRAPVFALNESQHTDPKSQKVFGNSVKEIVGWISDAKANATGVEGALHILKTAQWLRDNLVDAFSRGKTDLYGLSHEALGVVPKSSVLPQKVERIVKISEVDVVYDPALGGQFIRMAAARQNGQAEKEEKMLEKLLAALATARPGEFQKLIAAGKVIDGGPVEGKITEEEVLTLLAAAPAVMAPPNNDEAKQLLEQTRITAAAITLDRELADSGLPVLAAQRVRRGFEGKTFEAATLQAAIKEEKEYLDKLTGSGSVRDSGSLRFGNEEPERIQAAFDKMMGIKVADKFADVPALRGLRAAYTEFTGDEEVRGFMTPDKVKFGESFMQMLRLSAAYSSASFTYALGNSMYRRLVQDYNEVNYNEDILVSMERNAKDFRTMESIIVGYPGDLPDVDPEAADYAEDTLVTDTEITYAINQKGAIIIVTRKTIVNDDIGTIQRIISRRGRAARRTKAQRIWNKIITNATYKGDSKAIFHADHANLGAVTLTNDATGITTLTNRLVAMYNQTEPGSGKKMALRAQYLCVPIEKEAVAQALNQPWPIAGTINPNAYKFGQNNERIITLPLTTDTDDWGLVANKQDCEIMEIAYLNGQKEPELFVADNPLIDQTFIADKIRYKQRHEYEVEVVDYRGLDKSVV